MRNFFFGGVCIPSGLANFALLILRVFLGLAMIFVGLMKIPPSEQMIELVTKIGLPMPHFFAVLAGILEIVGGVSLVLGFFTRWGSLCVMAVVLTAIIFVHTTDPFMKRFLPLLVLFTSFQFLLIGAGKISIDARLRRCEDSGSPPQE